MRSAHESRPYAGVHISDMNKLPPQHWQHNGQTFTVSLYVEGETVVGMTPVTTTGGIVVPPKKYLGDHMGEAIAQLTGRKPCVGCTKVENGVNAVHKGAERIGQGIKKLVSRG